MKPLCRTSAASPLGRGHIEEFLPLAKPPGQAYYPPITVVSSVSSSSLPSPIASAQEGMRRGFARFSTAAEAVAQGNLDPGNVVGQIEGQRTYEMNAAVLKTADEMLGTLLDTKA